MAAEKDDKKNVVSASDIMAEIDELIASGGAAEAKPPIVGDGAGRGAGGDEALLEEGTKRGGTPMESAPIPSGAKFCFDEYTRYKVMYSKETDKELKKIYALSMKAMKFVVRNVYGKDMLRHLGEYS